MTDLLSLVAWSAVPWAAIFFAGFALGRVRRKPKSVQPTCGCEHSLALHDPRTKQCHGTVEQYPSGIGRRYARCACRQYVGPMSITDLWMPPQISDTEGD